MVDGTVRCWGDGMDGEVDGTDDGEHHTPVEVKGVTHAIDIVVGLATSCARIANGEVWCWGARELRGLDDEERIDPRPIAMLAHATKLWLGPTGDGCARWANGTTKCWGRGPGTLAAGSTGYDDEPRSVVHSLDGATDFALGESLGCAVMPDATAVCWGRNDDGQVGDGTTTTRLAPTPVRGLRNVAQVVVGDRSACARHLDGTVSCWGSDDSGQLGDGVKTDRRVPRKVPELRGVVELAGATVHTCARLDDGRITCWGNNWGGTLGDGKEGIDASPPVVVVGLARVIQVATSHTHGCAIRDDGTLLCWGDGTRGVLGDGMQMRRLTPVAVKWSVEPVTSQGLGGRRVAEIAVGDIGACARLDDGSLRCWGGNEHGEVDTRGADKIVVRPVVVPGLEHVAQLSMGGVPMARLADGTVVRWGWPPGAPLPLAKDAAELSEGGTYTCVRFADGRVTCAAGGSLATDLRTSNVVAVSSSWAFVCVLVKGGTVACAGFNNRGQLGPGNAEQRDSFATIPGLANVVAVVTGTDHACARLGDRTVRCWGDSIAVGRPAEGPVETPVEPAGLGPVEALWAGGSAVCARLAGGEVRCWGHYGLMQGERENWTSETPKPIPWLRGARSIAMGMSHSCALFDDGDVGCWGDNKFGQLGDGTMDARAEASRVKW
jgi:alpha-tubulin suppressor-like RCC1 family protein